MTRRYLDHNATAPVRPEAAAAAAEAMASVGNASSVHAEGRAARAIVESAREGVARLVNAPPDGVVFTSGGTEAVHAALHGAVGAGLADRLLVSAIEHVAVAANAGTTGAPVETIPVQTNGLVDLDALADTAARAGSFVCCLMLANNETGAIQPVAEAAAIVHEAGGLLFVDAAQAVGKIHVDFAALGADMMSLTGHKFGAPIGAGALVQRTDLSLAPVFGGGGHERGRRAGTQNAPALAGLAVACRLADDAIARSDEIAALRDDAESAVLSAGAKVWAGDVPRLPGTLCFSAPGFSGETQMMAMDLAGIAVSSGSACSSGKAAASHVLKAMGASDDEARSSVRVSFGWSSSDDDAAAFRREWPAAYDRARARAA
ncbi:MAG: cysteine desulfurase family protein [Parvularculaceae bacterium]